MAAQPFDKATAEKLAEVYKTLNSEVGKTLTQLEDGVILEQNMVNIAKSLGQVYKTQQDKLDEQLKGKNLQEQISIKLEQSEQKIEVLAASRIKSFINIQDLQNEIQTTSAKIEDAYAQNPYDEKAIAEHNTLNEKIAQLSLEKHLLSVSGSQLASLKLRNNLLKIGMI